MFDVLALGEALIDFSPSGPGPMGNPSFEMNPGGAPINCLAANVRLGGRCAFIGTVGNDFFGRFLQRSMDKIGIDTSGLVYTDTVPTTIGFVSNNEDGERDFAFFRDPGTDTMLEAKHVDHRLLKEAKIFHFGSLSLTNEPARSATYAALEQCKKNGLQISFDPNYRESLWPNKETAVAQMKKGAEYADIIKVSLEEMAMLTGTAHHQMEEGAQKLAEMGIKAVFVTAGARGAYYLVDGQRGFTAGYAVKAIDTTGCGDAFLGAIHFTLCHRPHWPMEEKVQFANASAALCATGRTGFPAMPDYSAVEAFLRERLSFEK